VQQEYFSDGMTEDLINELARLEGLLVIARTSAFTYKGKTVRPEQVSRELGVRYMLEGSVRKANNQIRITAQLVDGTTGYHVWAQTYDRDLNDIFAVQEEIARKITRALEVKLTMAEEKHIGSPYTTNQQAWELFMRGTQSYRRFTPQENARAREDFKDAIALDPKFARAYAALAATHRQDWVLAWVPDRANSEHLAEESADKAVALATKEPPPQPSLSHALEQRGYVYLYQKKLEAARKAADAAVAHNRNTEGFSLAGTLTMPQAMGRLQHPAVVLVAGSGSVDRDEVVAGIPIFAQLAGALAEQGFIVLRYDKRGVGQSGGRNERVTLQDYADDLITTVKWLGKRKDIDPRHITVAGHSEGGAVAMLAAAREKRIASIILIGAPGTAGSELILEQQRHVLDLMATPDAERQSKIDLQKQIQAAVVTDKGWESIPPDLRAQADSPWFRSLLLFDPAKIMPKIKQPILIIQGELDKQVFPHHADALAELARARKKAGPVEVVRLPGVNHLLARAETGEVSEYGTLPDKSVTPAAAKAMVEWLNK
jgi:TolB-like protein/pimeloyl-ACP methyl ester carboxylesterase